MDNKKYYWLKLKEDFFEEKQIKYLRKLPDGDKLVIAYLKMQLKSLKTEGFIKYDSILPSNIEELSMILDENINIVTLLIKALQQVGAIEILDDGSFYMIAMQELIGKEGASAERVRKFREKQKQNEIKLLQCNTNVTNCNTEIEKEKEIKIDKEIEIDKKINKYNDVVEIYNTYCTNLSQVQKLTEKRKIAINKLLKEINIEQFEEICKIANISDFLIGNNDRNWKADFDFIIRPDKAVSILEGKYNFKKKDKMDGFRELWEEARLEDEQAGNNTNNNNFGW
jgi:predicted phage replisome organizer